MTSTTKILGVVIIIILLLSSIFVIFFTGNQNDDETVAVDSIPPTIDSITGDATGTTGKITIIAITFSDDVTTATLYYRSADIDKWSNTSILSGSAELSIPSSSDEDWYYYVTVDDAEGNGPIGNPSIDGSMYYTITVTEAEKDLVHNVFVEEGTATWCSNCPEVADIIHEEYNSSDADFYYVSMVKDKSSKAEVRLQDDYNVFGYPTIYIDGGYHVIMGANNFKTIFKEELSKAKNREVPSLHLNVRSEWNETRNDLKNSVEITNYDDEKYTGTLKVYIAEINSPWSDWNGDPYKYAFVDYGYNNLVEIGANENKTFSETWDATGYSVENLQIIAVVFSSESHNGYSNPDENDQKFDAYYADAADGTRVTEGELPPSIGINTPKDYAHYILGKEKNNKYIGSTYIIGRITIKVNIDAESGVEKVEYAIKGPFKEIKETVTEEPYDYVWHKLAFGKYTITAKVYDNDGRTSTDSIEVLAFML